MRNFPVILASILMFATNPTYAEADKPPSITFHIQALDARSVEVIGDFNAWLPGSNFLHGPDQQGMWQVVITIPSGMRRSEYIYLVNGQQRVLDTSQPVISDDFGGKNNIWLSQ
jgi:1,4-alpha-glucan branching enzyme